MFKSHGYLPESVITCDDGSRLDLTSLPRFLRTLLVADGTVTKALEAYFWEPVSVIPVHQHREHLEAEIDGLPGSAGQEVLCREVRLQGNDTQIGYAVARSYLWLSRLDAEHHQALEDGRIGIGELLREQGIETYREIIGLSFLELIPPGDELLSQLSPPLVARSYRIRVAGEPAFLVTEFFPLERYFNA